MSILIVAPGRDVSEWKNGIESEAPEVSVDIWPDIKDPEAIEAALVWNHPPGMLNDFKNLKLISSMGAGVDHVLSDSSLPKGVPIVRIVDERLTVPMSNYIITAIMYFHRRLPKYILDKQQHRWDQAANPELTLQIGIMGMGVLGTDVAQKLQGLGFEVYGFSNSRKNIKGIKSYAGDDEKDEFLSNINVLVCLLPLTSSTVNILNLALFNRMKRGGYVINVARGRHLVEEDLLTALEKGQIDGAFLDVYRKEPLPENHPFWQHPGVMITPHIASITNSAAAIPQMVQNYRRAKDEQPLLNQVVLERGY